MNKPKQITEVLWTLAGPGEVFERETVNICKHGRGKWEVICFDDTFHIIERFHEDAKKDAFAVATEWLALDPNTSARAGKARTNAYRKLGN